MQRKASRSAAHLQRPIRWEGVTSFPPPGLGIIFQSWDQLQDLHSHKHGAMSRAPNMSRHNPQLRHHLEAGVQLQQPVAAHRRAEDDGTGGVSAQPAVQTQGGEVGVAREELVLGHPQSSPDHSFVYV